MRLFAFTLALPLMVSASALADVKGQPDPPPPTWNDPPPPGVETVKPQRPTWCAGYKATPWTPASIVFDDVKRGYTDDLLKEIAHLACDRPDDPTRQAWIAFYRQGWLNIVGTTQAEDAAAMAARMRLKEAEQQLAPVCARLRPTEEDALADRTFKRMRAAVIGCAGDPREITSGRYSKNGDESYWIDRDAEPPDELVRLAFVLRCFNVGSSTIDPAKVQLSIPYFAFCGHDAAKLSRATFEKSLAQLELPPLGLARARETFAYTRLLLAHDQAALQALIAKDPDYGKLAFAAPTQGFASWVALHDANKPIFDDALAMEDHFRDEDKHAVAGCGTKLRKQLIDHVRSRAPKTKEDVVDAANDDLGQPLLEALIACDSLEGRHSLVNTEHVLLGAGRIRRGPRTAAYWAAVDALAEMKDKSKKFLVRPEAFGVHLPVLSPENDWLHVAYEHTYNASSFDRDQKGQVAAVKPQGDGVLVSFKTESWQEAVYDCVETNRIERISPDGRVEYRRNCVQHGTETVHQTTPTAWIRKDLATGIKPGVTMMFRYDRKPTPAQGFPLEVTSGKRLVSYYGLPVAP